MTRAPVAYAELTDADQQACRAIVAPVLADIRALGGVDAVPHDTRGACPVCARVIHRRIDGLLRKHCDSTGQPCDGSETEPVGATS